MSEGLTGKATPGNEIIGFYIVSLIGKVLVEWRQIEPLIPFVNLWIIDIKDMNPIIYKMYTELTNERVTKNLEELSSYATAEKIFIRIPNIPKYTTENDVNRSLELVRKYGKAEIFTYKLIGEYKRIFQQGD